jgi:hypothetical protein
MRGRHHTVEARIFANRHGRRNHGVPHVLSEITRLEEDTMDGLIYLIGLIVIVMAILSFFGLR